MSGALLDHLPSEIVVLRNPGRIRGLRAGDLVRVRPGRGRLTLLGPNGASGYAEADPRSGWNGELLAANSLLLRLEQVDDIVALRLWRFQDSLRWTSPRTVAIDEEAVDATRRFIGATNVRDLIRQLETDLFVSDDPPRLVCFSRRGAPDAITFVAASYVLDVRLADDQLRVFSASRPRASSDMERLRLISGAVRLVEDTYADRLDPVAIKEHHLAAESSRYMQVWRDYTEREGKAALAAAGQIPDAQYVDMEVDVNGDFVFTPASGHQTERLCDLLVREGSLFLEASAAKGQSIGGDCSYEETALGPKILMRANRSGTRGRPHGSGKLSYSTIGSEVSLDRRIRALESEAVHTPRRAIETLLAHGHLPEAPDRRVRHEPLSDAALKAFGGTPTEAQRRALDVALNTPDFALIQGPPGTGKTRLIAALQARLDELHQRDRLGNDDRQVLLTGPQHDAVEHAVTASTLGRLPAIKLGARLGEENMSDEQVLRWRRALEDHLQSYEVPQAIQALLDSIDQLVTRVQSVRLVATPRDALEVLRWLAGSDGAPLLSTRTVESVNDLLARYERALATTLRYEDAARLRPALRRLRGSAAAFADDGAAQCRLVLDLFDSFTIDSDEDRQLLQQLGASIVEPTSEQLARLRRLRDHWLDVCARTVARGGLAGPELERVLTRARRDAEQRRETDVPADVRALDRFVRRVREEPAAIRDSLLTHTSTLAATLQQTDAKLTLEFQPAHRPYETVIVDEAARAVPGDLLIALSKARARIVLVGDHRQLPQHVDDDVVRGFRGSDLTHLRVSMFQRLFDALDGVAGPQRRVTLDEQFRMHPRIGTFVSETFYARHGEGFGNAVTAASRPLDRLPVQDALTWVDVPASAGCEEGRFRRPSEAVVVADWLAQLLDSDPDVEVGIITPYRDQTEAIWAELRSQDRGTRNRHNRWEPDRAWHTAFRSGVPRFRIGTVDSYQGREFDVVVFSPTRCACPARPTRQHFGFLRSPNRLNVALSRARSALIVVGDRRFFADHAAEEVPALHALARGIAT